MGFIDKMLGQLSEREKLIMDAGHVGETNEVIRMGILCAQLGLTEEDISKMARVYLILQGIPSEHNDSVSWLLVAARAAQSGD